MASYRQIHTKMWTDPWFIDLTTDEKLVFIYLFSNDRVNVLGIYDISPKTIAHETDIDKERVKEILNSFEATGKIIRDGTWVWVVKMFAYNATNTKSPKIHSHIDGLLRGLGNTVLRDKWIERYGIYLDESGIDTVSYPIRTDTYTDTNTDTDTSSPNIGEVIDVFGEELPSRTKITKKNRSPEEISVDNLVKYFGGITHIPPEIDHKTRQKLWRNPLKRILLAKDGDEPLACKLIDLAITASEQASSNGDTQYPISSPNSIVKFAMNIHRDNSNHTGAVKLKF